MINSVEATKKHCKLCFDALLAVLKNNKKPQWPTQLPDVQTPIFVTWKKDGDLRGCIGTFSPDKLSKIIPEYAIISAMKDTRFNPVSIEEVPQLSVNVSLLINFTEQKDVDDWEVGKHGIIIKSNLKGRSYSGTFLPEVAKEQQWSKTQTLQHLVKKGGYYGNFQEILPTIKLTTYESSKASMSYAEYMKDQI